MSSKFGEIEDQLPSQFFTEYKNDSFIYELLILGVEGGYRHYSNSRFEQKHMWKTVKFFNIS
jgi:hypothetical protein